MLAVRNTALGGAVAAEIDGQTEVHRLDLADLTSIRAFAKGWDDPIDLLINNAGVMAIPRATTAQGFEMQIGTNHLGHFALTMLLLPQLTDRIVTVSSDLARGAEIDLDDLNWERRRYRPWQAYSQSKLANLLFTAELQRRLDHHGSRLRAHAAHPGVATTGLQRTGRRLQDIALLPLKLLAQGPERGALPTLFAATEDLEGGTYVGPDGRMGTRRSPTPVDLPAEAQNGDVAVELWGVSVSLTGTDLPADGLSSSGALRLP